jgi:probable rRNA maturation factor
MSSSDPSSRRRPDLARRTRLRVQVVDGRGRPGIAPGLAAWLSRVAGSRARGLVTVAIVDDRRVRRLNRAYRGIDRTTDVLSFPSAEASLGRRAARRRLAGRELDPVPPPLAQFLGDIVIAQGVAGRQAHAAAHDTGTELRILALHGLLHLLGYDHEVDGGRMARLERRLRRVGRLREGLIERTRATRGREAGADR